MLFNKAKIKPRYVKLYRILILLYNDQASVCP